MTEPGSKDIPIAKAVIPLSCFSIIGNKNKLAIDTKKAIKPINKTVVNNLFFSNAMLMNGTFALAITYKKKIKHNIPAMQRRKSVDKPTTNNKIVPTSKTQPLKSKTAHLAGDIGINFTKKGNKITIDAVTRNNPL